jgi:hypothetical protein
MADAIPVHAPEEKKETPKKPAPKKAGKVEERGHQGPPVPGEQYKLPDGTVVTQF